MASPSPSLARGALLALALSHTWARYGAGPLPTILSLTATLFFLQTLPPIRRPRRIGVGTLIGLAFWDRFGQWPAMLSIPERLGAEILLELGILALLASAIRGCWRRPTQGLWTGLGLVTLVWPWGPLLSLGVLFAWGPRLEEEEEPTKRHLPSVIVGSIAVVGTLAFWCLHRAILDPTPSGFLVGLGAAGLGLLTGRSRWMALPGMAALIGMGTISGQPPLLIFGLGGLGLGWLLSATGRQGIREGLLASTVLLFGLPLIETVEVSGTWAVAPIEADRVEKLRSSRPLRYTQAGLFGTIGLRAQEGRFSLEREGVLVDPSGRLGQAERFAGLLAGCVSPSRRRAMVLGDEMGLASLALKNQGFTGIDVAVSDRGLYAAEAQWMPLLQKLWLDPRLRLLPVPAGFLKRFGDRPDVVVEILREPWADGFTAAQMALPPVSGPVIDDGPAPEVIQILVAHLLDFDRAGFGRLISDLEQRGTPVTLWLPPSGADSVILVVSPQPLRWADLESCVVRGKEDMKILGLSEAMDISALALAQNPDLGATDWMAVPRLVLPRTLLEAPQLLLTDLADLDVPPTLFLDAPPERAARVKTRGMLLHLLANSAAGNVAQALEQARLLSSQPGGDLAVAPLVKPYLDQARAAMEKKDWVTAEAALSAAEGLFPGVADSFCLQGTMMLSREEWSKAETAFSACAAKDPGRLEALYGLGMSQERSGNLAGAEKSLRQAASAHPEIWKTSESLGSFLLQQNRLEEAERWLIQASARNSAMPSPSPSPDLALAHLYLQTRKAPLALAQAERALSHATSSADKAEGLYLKGAAHFELNHLDLAEQAFSDCLEADPNYYLAKGGLGQVQASRGQYQLAAQSWQAVLAKDPTNQEAKENLARVQSFLRQ